MTKSFFLLLNFLLLFIIFNFTYSKVQKVKKIEIAHGVLSLYEEFPHMVSLNDPESEESFCGGGLINKRTIITAAHCVYDNEKGEVVGVENLVVGIGSNDVTKLTNYQVDSIVVHSEYNSTTISNDIALIILKVNISESNITRYMETEEKEVKIGTKVWVTGWGLKENGNPSKMLNKVFVPVVDLSFCAYGGLEQVDITICAGEGITGKDSCAGDSGGPMVRLDSGNDYKRWVVVGIVSYGPSECGAQGNYGSYTNVSHYSNWIWSNSKFDRPSTTSHLDTLYHISDKFNDTRNCFGILSSDSGVCTKSRGECYLTDKCDCNAWFDGDQCENFSKYGKTILGLAVGIPVGVVACLLLCFFFFAGLCMCIAMCASFKSIKNLDLLYREWAV